MQISIIIVNWNTKDLLRDCLQSIYEYSRGFSFEVIVVDNASNDDSCSMVKSLYPECILIESKENLGFVKGNNLGLSHAKGDYIFYLNPDTRLISNSIFAMKKMLDDNADLGAVGCKLIYPSGKTQYVCARTFPTPLNQFFFLSLLNRIFPHSRFFSTVELGFWDHNDSRYIDCLSGACILARSEIINTLGGFDENIFMYAEDVDLCYQIKQLGWKLFYLADQKIIHFSGASSKQKSYSFFSAIRQRDSNLYFFEKHFGRYKAKQYLIAVFLGSFARIILIPFFSPLSILSRSVRRLIPPRSFVKYSKLFFWSLNKIWCY